MRKTAALILAVAAVAFAGNWDGNFERVGTFVPTAGAYAQLQVKVTDGGISSIPAPYVKVNCSDNAYVGVGRADAGCVTDGGQFGNSCDLIRFSVGEKFYAQFAVDQTHVVAQAYTDGGTVICNAFRQRN